MENWIFAYYEPLAKSVLSALAIFVIVIIVTRVAGLRTFAKMSSFDFASTIAMGTIIASVIMNGNQSILKGGIALAAVVGFQFLFSLAVRKSKKLKNLLSNSPMMLMRDGEILYDNLAKTNISESDVIAKMREANVIHLSEVKAMILEGTGDISVLHTTEDTQPDDILLKNVRTD